LTATCNLAVILGFANVCASCLSEQILQEEISGVALHFHKKKMIITK